MGSGDYREWIELQSPTHTTSNGNTTTAFSEAATVKARVEALGGRELWAAQQAEAQTTWQVTIRYHQGLAPKADWRIKWGDLYLKITAPPRPDPRRRTWVLDCTETEA